MHGVDRVEHGLRVSIARGLEVMRTPLVVSPIVPVLHDVIHRDVVVAEIFDGGEDVVLCAITLAALPEAHDPLGHDLALAREGAISADDVVHVLTLDEIVVLLAANLAPQGKFVLLLVRHRRQRAQCAIALASVRLPVDVELNLLTLLEVELELAAVRVPSRAPNLREELLVVHEDSGVAGVVDEETVSTRLLRLQVTVKVNVSAHQREALGQVLPVGHEVGEIEDRLGAVNSLGARISVRCPMT